MSKKRILSGIQPTGSLHLGNYLGAISQWVTSQSESDSYFCVVDWHALTVPEAMNRDERHAKNREVLALYLAAGIDPEMSTVFIQSHVKEHTELGWILNCVTPLGWLERMTQFKSKGKRQKSVSTGLLDYPVLQAADILLYDTDVVPVGEDQKQHIELCCDIAQRFNHLFGETLKVPKVQIKKETARIMGFDNPENKMSKSTGEEKSGHAIGLLDSEKRIKKTVMGAVTDSGSLVNFEHGSLGIKNLLSVYQALSKERMSDIEKRYDGRGYGYLKKDLLEQVLNTVRPIQAKYHEITSDQAELDRIIKEGADKARAIASKVMARVNNQIGLG